MTNEPLTPGQQAAIASWSGHVPVQWFVGETRDDGSREFIALGGMGAAGFAWSVLVEADGDVHTSEAPVGPWETGVNI